MGASETSKKFELIIVLLTARNILKDFYNFLAI